MRTGGFAAAEAFLDDVALDWDAWMHDHKLTQDRMCICILPEPILG